MSIRDVVPTQARGYPGLVWGPSAVNTADGRDLSLVAVDGIPQAESVSLAPRRDPRGSARMSRLALPLADAVALAAAVVVSRTAGWVAVGYAVMVLVVLTASRQHRLKITPRVSDDAGRLALAAVLPVLVTLPWLGAGAAARLVITTAVLLGAGRAVTYQIVRTARRRGRLTENLAIVGTGPAAQELARLAKARPELGLQATGFVGRPSAGVGRRPAGSVLPLLGRSDDLAGVIRRYGIGRVIVAVDAEEEPAALTGLRAARELPVDICVLPRLPELGGTVPRSMLDEIWGLPLVPLRRIGTAGRVGKRLFDLTVASILLVLTSPLILTFGVITRLQLRRPALFRQVRVTGAEQLAVVVKLRTIDEYQNPDTCWAVPMHRSTAFGRFLRGTHLDELPQLTNVVRGHMSLVGPRPERPYFAHRFEQEIPGYADRLRMKAGLTGWAQIHGLTGDTSIHDRARFDNAYIENWSFWLDLVILTRTITDAFKGVVTHPAGHPPRPAIPPTEPPEPDGSARAVPFRGDHQ
jgi:exopolysaccharide biosynthesis polyprenyl glycosylphosphotransferase